MLQRQYDQPKDTEAKRLLPSFVVMSSVAVGGGEGRGGMSQRPKGGKAPRFVMEEQEFHWRIRGVSM